MEIRLQIVGTHMALSSKMKRIFLGSLFRIHRWQFL